jgi:hypothetical protein
MIKLSKTQIKVLTAAANRHDGAIHPLPDRINGGVANKVITGLKKWDLITDATGNDGWQINDHGYEAIGQEPPLLTPKKKATAEDKLIRKTRTGTKQARIIEMLKRPEGATVEQIAKEVNWKFHTVRGFFAGTIKKKFGLELIKNKQFIVSKDKGKSTSCLTTYHLAK